MSATGRGATRRAHDAYFTPSWSVWRFLDFVEALDRQDRAGAYAVFVRDGGSLLEPCVGDGSILTAVNEWRLQHGRKIPAWTVVDIRDGAARDAAELAGVRAAFTGDFVRWELDPLVRSKTFDATITNPPYSLAERFARETCRTCRVGVHLLRLNFLEGRDRHAWISRHVPDTWTLPNRPSFDGGGTDATAYAWLGWPTGDAERLEGVNRILDLTGGLDR